MKFHTWDLPYDEEEIEVWAEKMSDDRAATDRILDDLEELPIVSIGPSGIFGPYQKEW